MINKFIISLVAFALIAIPLNSCSWIIKTTFPETSTKKQIIENLYTDLCNKTHAVHDLSLETELIFISNELSSAASSANLYASKNDYPNLGKQITIQLQNPQTISEAALNRLVADEGNGEWSISTLDYQWLVNASGGAITGGNDKATEFINKITLTTYYNSTYGFYIDYPSSWTVDDNITNVLIYSGSSDLVNQYIFINPVDKAVFQTFANLSDYISARELTLKNQYYQFNLINNIDSGIYYTYTIKPNEVQYAANHYFIIHNGDLYELVCGAQFQPSIALLSGQEFTPIFDASQSFRFSS